MSAFAISLASFLGLFGACCAVWEMLERREQGGRRLLARMGVKAAEPEARAMQTGQRGWRQWLTRIAMAGAPARAEWTERWIIPSVLAGGLLGGFGMHRLLQSVQSAHLTLGIVIGAAAGAGIGWAACRRWQRNRWAREISYGLIDLLDLWILCLDAGMSFQSALARAAQDSELARPALRRELQLTHQEIMAGCPSDEALRHLVKRCRSATELSGLVSHIIQAEKLGGSIAKTLQVYANSLRFNRYQDMKEAVQKMPAKLAFPLIFCILPCLLIVIAGPAFLRLLEVLSRRS